MATIEGRNPVIEAIKNDREIDKIMIANSAKEGSIKKIIGMEIPPVFSILCGRRRGGVRRHGALLQIMEKIQLRFSEK